MSDWNYLETAAAEEYCIIEHYGIKKVQEDGSTVEFLITVREYARKPDPAMAFFAQADKQVNQTTAPYTPSGWGLTRSEALRECIKAIRKFPYQP